jgi:peptidoglycan/LPS O-acetylase OafA/YrhL
MNFPRIIHRDLNLDFVKGFLVICMVMYHTISYFTTAGYDGTKYVRFVTGSFIFISGYIVAVFYQKKFELNKIKICRRLLTRGLKLLLIFTFLNITINLLGIQSHKLIHYKIELYLMNLGSIYIKGNSIYAVFQIIVPIAYLLLLSPILLIFQKWRKTIIIVTSILLLAHVAFNIASFNLYGLLIGLVGLSFGLIGINHETYAIKFKSIIIIMFCITIFMMEYFDRNIISYAIGIMIILKLVYDFSKTQDLAKYFNKLVVLLGQYSLLSYLMQIFFLQSIYQLFIKQRFDLGYEAFVIFVITNIFLILLCLLLDLLRSKFRLIDKSYKLIFS